MNSQAALVYFSAIGVCAVMAIFNAARFRKRGAAALIMASAFLTFGATAYLVVREAPQGWVTVGLSVTFALLIADFVVRSIAHGRKDPRR